MTQYNLWEDSSIFDTKIEHYQPIIKTSKAAVVVFPGGAYFGLAEHEGRGYAEALNAMGITAFVVKYRVAPFHFPDELSDARRAVRFVRANAEKFGLDKDKILAMGSSAGGHLTALLSTYRDKLSNENYDSTDREDYLPNAQILCYPVICSNDEIGHLDSYQNLLGDLYSERDKFSPELLADEKTPKAFIWHTSSDQGVNVINSYRYAEALAKNKVQCEMHIFPMGYHGLGTAPNLPYVATWLELFRKWLIYNKFIDTGN